MTSKRIEEDLAASGIVIQDMSIRQIDNAERAATNVAYSDEGYVIPYFNLYGKSVPFYRVKLFDHDPKYKQPKDTPNHLYFPKGFKELADRHPYVIFTEGEKKATLACKLGFPTVGVSGVESWRNRIFTLPTETEMSSSDKNIKAKVPSGAEHSEDFMSPLAMGLQDLMDYILDTGKHVIIVYDTDNPYGTSHNVQKAAATLGYELRFRGIPFNKIRQLMLPFLDEHEKVGLDDFLMEAPDTAFPTLITNCIAKRSAFPRHPNVRDYVNKRLQKARMSRKEMQAVSMAILTELDSGGLRLRSREALETYYFDTKTHKLLKTGFNRPAQDMTENAFGQHLYRSYGIGAADQRIVQWLGTQFTGEDPVEDVSPYRVIARPEQKADKIIYQLSDGQYVEITGEEGGDTPGFTIKNNGEEGILFESDQVTPLNIPLLREEYAKQVKGVQGSMENWWGDVLNQVRLVDKDRGRIMTSLLFYISPFLNRWRGTQLPIEMTLGEAGSGKSTLQELRLAILTGRPKLRNAPQDMKDWSASVTNTGGLHITDNLQLADKNMRQHLSDEICRIITEPNPSIEARKYYTNADLINLPVRCVFGITAIKQPFLNSDVLQRSFLIELDKSLDLINGNLTYDSQWMNTQLQRFGGREAWMAHQLLVLHMFLVKVRQKWNMKYQAKHRLINFEQSAMLMAEIFGINPIWIPEYLNGSTNRAVTDADWAFEGLIQYCATLRANGMREKFGAQEISNWALGMQEYEKCDELTNSRRVGRYLKTHKTMIASICGMIEAGSQNNRQRYQLVEKKL